MLNKEAKMNIENIKSAAEEIWGKECVIVSTVLIDAPFSMFNMYMNIYGAFEVLLTYDRSILGIQVKVRGEFTSIRKLSDEEIIGGFDSCKPESLLHNFKVLDNTLKSMDK